MPILPRAASGGGSGTTIFNVKEDYGAVGNGVTDDRLAIQAAIDAATAAGGGTIYFPEGTYLVSRNGVNAYSFFLTSDNLTFLGEKGLSWVKHPAGLPATVVRMFFVHQCDHVTFRHLGLDGNWGNAVTYVAAASAGAALPQATITVDSTADFPTSGTFNLYVGGVAQVITYTGKSATTFTGCSGGTGTMLVNATCGRSNTQDGLNHSTSGDPQNHLVMFQDCKDALVDGCLFRQAYGDAVWAGHSSFAVELGYSQVTIRGTQVDMCARDGFVLGGPCDGFLVDDCRLTNIYAQAFDSEPGGNYGFTRGVLLDNSYFGGWWAPFAPRTGNSPIAISGGEIGIPSQSSFARTWRLRNCTVIGSIGVNDAVDVVIDGCRIICDFDGSSTAPVNLYGFCDDVWVQNNYIFDRTGNGGTDHYGSISVRWYGSEPTLQSANIYVLNNKIFAQNGRRGIHVEGTGGFGHDTDAINPAVTGTATATGATTMTHTGAGWTVNRYAGWQVRIGAATATVVSNTSEVLTIGIWHDPLGTPVATPTAGVYYLTAQPGIVHLKGNTIDCSNRGYGLGGKAIYIDAERAGMRVKINDNNIRNADTDAIYIKTWDTARLIRYLEISGNTAWDDQVTPTCTNVVTFAGGHFDTLVLRDNTPGQGVTTEVSGLTGGRWKVGGNQWAGYGTPEGVITARPGSMYQRIDGAGVIYVKETSIAYSTGWVALETTNRVAIRALGTVMSGTGALTVPSASSVDGDLELLFLHTSDTNNASALTTPNGFVLLTEKLSTYIATKYIRTAVYVRRVSGAMSDAVTTDTNAYNVAMCISIKDCLEFGDPLDVIDVFEGTANDSNTLPVSLTGDTTTVAGTLVLALLSAFSGGVGSISGWTNADLTEIEEQYDASTAVGGEYIHLAVMSAKKATAGAFGATTATIAATYSVWAGVMLAIKPRSGNVGTERFAADDAASPNIERTFVSGAGIDLTLAAGTIDGFEKTVIVASGTGTFTPAALANGNVLTWTDFAGFTLVWDATGATWHVTGTYGNVVVS